MFSGEPKSSTWVKYRMTGTKLMKTKLALPTMLRKSAASPNLALPRTILKSTWGQGRQDEWWMNRDLPPEGAREVLRRTHLPSTWPVSGTGLLLSVYHIRQHWQLWQRTTEPRQNKAIYHITSLIGTSQPEAGEHSTHVSIAPVTSVSHFIICHCLLPPSDISRRKLVLDFLHKIWLCIYMICISFVALQRKEVSLLNLPF